jgi:hypothetical protein
VEFDENPDHRAIREAVAKIAAPFGGQYYTTHAEEHTPTDELWHALGRLGRAGPGVRGDGRPGRALAAAAGLERDLR